MSKNTNFTGQPIFNQLLSFLDKGSIKKIGIDNQAERYVKKFTTYHHVVVMLFVVLEGYESIREVITGLLANANKLGHLGLDYLVKRSTLSEANARRASKVFEQVYMDVYSRWGSTLTDSHMGKNELKRLYIMDSTTISLFKCILKGVGRNPKDGKKKGGIKAHTIIKYEENTPCFIDYTESAKHDHTFLKDVDLPKGSILCFDKGYVDYQVYQQFTENEIWYVTRLKDNATYTSLHEFDIPEQCDSGVLKDEQIEVCYGKNKELSHKCRRIAYWDNENKRLLVFLTNNMKFEAETVALIYKKRWKIELLFKQLKQNFPLKYFLGDNANAIEIQIWSALLANLLIMLVRNQVKRKWSFSNLVSTIRRQLMNYIDVYAFLEDPEKAWREVIKERKRRNGESSNLYTLFPDMEGA